MIYAFVKIIVILDVARRYVWGRWRVTMRRRWRHRHMEHGAQMVLGYVARDDECHERLCCPSTASFVPLTRNSSAAGSFF